MIKKIGLAILVIILVGVVFVYIRTRPSGDINKYKTYFTNDTSAPRDGEIKASFFGVSTLLLDDGKTQLLIDGFFSRPSITSALFTDIHSDTVEIARVLGQFGINRLKGIFVTHSHYDHVFDAGYVSKMTGATLYGSVSTLNVGRGAGVAEDMLKLYQPNTDVTIGEFTIRVVPSKHSPGNALKDDGVAIAEPLPQPASMKVYSEGGSYDFFITHRQKKIFIKPSPNFIVGALDSLKADVLFLGIPTITKQDTAWTEQFYKENVTSLKPALVIPLHWDNFFYPLSDNLVMLPKFTCNAEKDFDFFIGKATQDHIDFKILQGTHSIILK
ncbi:MAG: MBL fold metallo-hydrolase [Bacteroidota bacterium]